MRRGHWIFSGRELRGQPRPGDLFPGLDEPDRHAGALAQHRIEDLRREIADRNGIAVMAFSLPCALSELNSPSRSIRPQSRINGTRQPEPARARPSEDGIAGRLLAWYDAHHRDLPWRVAPPRLPHGVRPDPYRVWLSEIMLQQTTVEAVKPYFRKFLEKWPMSSALPPPKPKTS